MKTRKTLFIGFTIITSWIFISFLIPKVSEVLWAYCNEKLPMQRLVFENMSDTAIIRDDLFPHEIKRQAFDRVVASNFQIWCHQKYDMDESGYNLLESNYRKIKKKVGIYNMPNRLADPLNIEYVYKTGKLNIEPHGIYQIFKTEDKSEIVFMYLYFYPYLEMAENFDTWENYLKIVKEYQTEMEKSWFAE